MRHLLLDGMLRADICFPDLCIGSGSTCKLVERVWLIVVLLVIFASTIVGAMNTEMKHPIPYVTGEEGSYCWWADGDDGDVDLDPVWVDIRKEITLFVGKTGWQAYIDHTCVLTNAHVESSLVLQLKKVVIRTKEAMQMLQLTNNTLDH